MNIRKNYIKYILALLLVLATIAILDNLRISDFAEEMQKENNKLVEKVDSLEKELSSRSNETGELKKENERLVENLSQLEEEVNALKPTIKYQDFVAAKNTIETYKSKESFNEVIEFIAIKNGTGFSTIDREGNCPCSFLLNGKAFEWIPNAVLSLKEFSIVKEKILLTYITVSDIKHNYQFTMTKELGKNNSAEKWRIEEIKLKEKGIK